MEKFFIMKDTGKQEVEGKRLTLTVNGTTVCQAFVTNYGQDRTGSPCVVTEMSSGLQVGQGQSEKAAKKHAEDRIAFVGIERFGKMVADAVAKYGVANK
jgi:hypothetical protein